MRDDLDVCGAGLTYCMKWVGQEAATTGGSFSTTNPVYRDCSRPCCRANSSSPFALLVSCPRPPCLSVSLRKSASKNSNGQYRMRLKMGTMRRSVSHGHRRPLTRPGLAPCCALPRWRVGVALFIWPRPLMGFGLAVLLLCIGCPRLVHRLACPPLVLPRACPPQVHHTLSCVACCRGHAEYVLCRMLPRPCGMESCIMHHTGLCLGRCSTLAPSSSCEEEDANLGRCSAFAPSSDAATHEQHINNTIATQ
jgi:hypothetical protein